MSGKGKWEIKDGVLVGAEKPEENHGGMLTKPRLAFHDAAIQVSFRLDGTSHSDPYYQQNQPFPFPDALQEFSIQTSNYSAAQGNSAGAVVNAVTRSGTNALHGGAFGYLRDRKFTAKNYFNPEKDFLKRKQYGGFAGGPIVRNRMFFFGGWPGTTIAHRGPSTSATATSRPAAPRATGP